jgi:cell division protein FtsQ
MAQKQGPSSDDPFYRRGAANRSYADDALPLDAGLSEDDGEEDEQQFRRAPKRIPVRRGALASKNARRVRIAFSIVLTVAVLGGAAYETYSFATTSPRFRLRSDSEIELVGDAPNSRAEVEAQMHALVGRNVFRIALDERKQELERIPWVESASVARIWPNRLRVLVKERTPIAFAALSDCVMLVDANGVLMELSPQRDYSFPVILGMSDNEPLSTRAPRVRQYLRLVHELDNGPGVKAQYSRDVEEVDLSDPEDVKVLAKGGYEPILLHLGNQDFYARFMIFLSNVQRWEQERGKLRSVDLRYGPQVILNPDQRSVPPPAAAPAKADAASPATAATNSSRKPAARKKRK